MKHLINNIRSSVRRASVRSYAAVHNARRKLAEDEGQFVMDHAVVFVIIIVLGGVSLLLLKNYLNDELSNTLKSKINEFFN